MKRLLTLTLIASLAFFTSCEDDSKSRFDFGAPNGRDGAMVTLAKETLVIDVTNISGTSFDIVLETPSNNVVSYDLAVRKVVGNSVTEYYPMRTISTFPANESIFAADIATALGVDISTLGAGDRFDFYGTAHLADGTTATYNDLDPDLQSEIGQRQGFTFTTYISCPFVASEGVGTYNVTVDPFGATLMPDFDIVEGANAGELVMIDVMGHARDGGLPSPGTYDIIALIDADSGIITVEDYNNEVQEAWDSSNYGLPYGIAWLHNGFGFLFGCSGQLTIDWQHSVTIGTYGLRHFEAAK